MIIAFRYERLKSSCYLNLENFSPWFRIHPKACSFGSVLDTSIFHEPNRYNHQTPKDNSFEKLYQSSLCYTSHLVMNKMIKELFQIQKLRKPS